MSEKQDLINSAEDVAERAWIFYTAIREAWNRRADNG